MNQNITGIYIGKRDVSFKNLIIKLLKKGNLKQKYIDVLTSPESMEVYSHAFTSDQVDAKNNYQVYEQLGDTTCNKFIVYYMYERFPKLKCAEGVKVVARLKINYGSKNSFSCIAEKFGFWDFITGTNECRQRSKKSLLEDTFEAFIGATECIIDQKFKIAVGYACVYRILAGIFNDIDISLKYEDLYDAKTRLKELFDIYTNELGPLKYEEKRVDLISYSNVYRLQGAQYETKSDGTLNTNKIIGKYNPVLIGSGSAALKADSEQKAANNALEFLAKSGFVKFTPAIYSQFSGKKVEKTKTTKADVIKIIENPEKINEQLSTKGKSKYQNKYTSTALALYARKRDMEGVSLCLNLGSTANIKDSEGMTVLDLLFIGTKSQKIKQIFDVLFESGERLVHKNIFDAYCVKYKFDNLKELELIE